MPTDDSLYTPRNLGGVLARIAETPDGGARIEVWVGDKWEPPPPGTVDFAEIMAARPASDAFLARKGVPSGCPADVTIISTGESDDLAAERVMPGWKLPKWLWVMFILSLAVTIVVAIYPWK